VKREGLVTVAVAAAVAVVVVVVVVVGVMRAESVALLSILWSF
jgi:hypothetical protein